jgi:multidrug efflux pump subunit AcrA (membrane-fusion protein)
MRSLLGRFRPRSLTLYSALGVIAALAVVFGVNSVYGFLDSSTSSAGTQRTATVSRGTVQSSVTASGGVALRESVTADGRAGSTRVGPA